MEHVLPEARLHYRLELMEWHRQKRPSLVCRPEMASLSRLVPSLLSARRAQMSVQ